ncbi:MAG TPA: polyprenol monophosphomannose synthase [Tepidisphaeraceae bacterium]|nr:polyprenol monophosphomannose synthase [Tepidisphaeraceae bacterium]
MRANGPSSIEISIIVPTLNEAENLPLLVERIDGALNGRLYEILVMDDGSPDGTAEVCQRLARQYPLALHVRQVPANGLSGAVLNGLTLARGEYLVVMDADLQHPPECIVDLLLPLERGEADFVLGSRYVKGGGTDRRWGPLRRINSRVATMLARPVSGDTRDPMSGFFALKRQTYLRAGPLTPVGYKIALELLCKCRVRRVREVPIQFALRHTGRSKLTVAQQVRYLEHLSRLYDFCFPRTSRWVKFAIATGCAWLAAFSLYVRLVAHDIGPAFAPTLAFAACAAVTAAFHLRALRVQGRAINSRREWRDFALVILGEWSVCALASRWLASHILHTTVIEVFALTFGAATIARYALRTRLLHDLRGVRNVRPISRSTPVRRAA